MPRATRTCRSWRRAGTWGDVFSIIATPIGLRTVQYERRTMDQSGPVPCYGVFGCFDASSTQTWPRWKFIGLPEAVV